MPMKNKLSNIAGSLPIVALAAILAAPPASSQQKFVAVTAIVEHPALDAARDGVLDELEANGYSQGQNLRFTYESAQGNPTTAAQIARKLVGQGPDVIVPISTPSAQSVASATKQIPIVFSAVTDPLAAGLVSSLQAPGANVTGVSDDLPLAQHLQLIKEAMPGIERIGVPFNPAEANSVSLLRRLKQLALNEGLRVYGYQAAQSSFVQQAAMALAGRVDAIYALTDNTVVSALETIVKVAEDRQTPLFAADTASVERGASAAVGFDYYQVGRETGKLVVRILRGEDPASMPVVFAQGSDLFVNPAAARRQGLELPQAMIDRATEVIR